MCNTDTSQHGVFIDYKFLAVFKVSTLFTFPLFKERREHQELLNSVHEKQLLYNFDCSSLCGL